ncbi:GNAT family N-acetyltransferase [Lachnospiraceae bacterium 48-42]
MIYELAKTEDLQTVYDVVQHTIKTVYPKYYPIEVVDFFCEHHSMEAIAKDIENGYVSVLKIDENIVATGCFADDHITRVYVLPEFQKKGYGTFIMKTIEAQIGEKHDKVYLDASLPAAALYEKLGFSTTRHERYLVENGVILAYEIMEKELHQVSAGINYDGRKFVPKPPCPHTWHHHK